MAAYMDGKVKVFFDFHFFLIQSDLLFSFLLIMPSGFLGTSIYGSALQTQGLQPYIQSVVRTF